uniref:C-type lectin domain-containing protein n=1 Tax=Anolis carolinensis TaxID=28377 RepID=A0A803T5H0_ANOCA|nr:PREDICTED: low affinity immunoglobulin epsilon Fc receptor isoform X2 [Anolis carolinensis]|eukprot:XP_008115669.1 PREDICTED: low affinity immunoglobulin epsilon Fc receptor isoform X2 [Anolis carolinensis]
MAQEEQYGNWLPFPQLPSTRTELHQSETYVLAGPSIPPLPLKTNLPISLHEDDDYDDGGFVTPKVPESKAMLSAAEKREDTENQNVVSTAESTHQRKLHIFILYVAVAICFALCAGLLSLVLIKHSAMSEELQALKLNYSEMLVGANADRQRELQRQRGSIETSREERIQEKVQGRRLFRRLQQSVWKSLDYIRKIMGKDISISEFQNITASICGWGRSLVPNSCPTKWAMKEKNCYYFSTEKKNWTDALWHCVNQESDLVSIWSDEEQSFLKDNLNASTHWLGMTDIETDGKWRWKEGNLHVSTAFWDKGEPERSQEKNCGIIQPNGRWSSAVCSLYHHWICKKKLIC